MSKGIFAPVSAVDELDDLIVRSQGSPTALFLHDKWCPISARAYKEMSRLAEEDAAKTALVDVTSGQALSHAIEERTGVRHESPQVIVLRHGKVAWHASHFAITARAVADALTENA